MYQVKSPILFLVFNRPEVTKRVFSEIRRVRPKHLFIACDGPRSHVPNEAQQVKLVKQVVSRVDWPCEVKTLYREQNVGCKTAVGEAITWFFQEVEEGIILEDDCLPSLDFFQFCDTMLHRYRYDQKVLHIGGTNPIADACSASGSYYYSSYNRIWGWATWRDAWKLYDPEISDWQIIKQKNLLSGLISDEAIKYYTDIFDLVAEGKINTWDYQWFLARLMNGVAVIPCVNLISNIGFGNAATHTTDKNNPLANLPIGKLDFPLAYLDEVKVDRELDAIWEQKVQAVNATGILSRIMVMLKRILKI